MVIFNVIVLVANRQMEMHQIKTNVWVVTKSGRIPTPSVKSYILKKPFYKKITPLAFPLKLSTREKEIQNIGRLWILKDLNLLGVSEKYKFLDYDLTSTFLQRKCFFLMIL